MESESHHAHIPGAKSRPETTPYRASATQGCRYHALTVCLYSLLFFVRCNKFKITRIILNFWPNKINNLQNA